MELGMFFNPQSIAVVGVSREPKKVGHLIAKNLLDQGYKGEVFFINPKADTILGKKIYKDIGDVRKPIDLAVVALPADLALASLDQIHELGIKHVVLYAAGFKESDPDGIKKEELLKQKADGYGLTILGPNCIGFINTEAAINTTFLKHRAPQGNIGFISQSGALGAVLLDYFAARKNLGFSYFISVGNKTVLDESDALEFLATDSKTQVIGIYLEDVTAGDKLHQTLKKVSRLKPIIVLKSGITSEGAKAALSHTGGLAGDDAIFDTVLHESGVIRADNYTELIGLLKLYSFNRLPSSKRVLVLSNAGGVGVLLTDQIIHHGLELTTISHKTKTALKKSFDEIKKITLHNPIDLLGDASAFEYETAITSTLTETDIGSIIVLLTPQANTQIPQTAAVIKQVQDTFKKPIYPIFMGEKSIEHSHIFFEEHHIASFETYERVPVLLKKILERHVPHETQESATVYKLSVLGDDTEIKTILKNNFKQKFLNYEDSLKLIQFAGVPTLHFQYIKKKSHTPSVIKYPVVAKVASDKITHKTEVKGVIPHIQDSKFLKQAVKSLEAIKGSTGVYIQPHVEGLEIFMGAKRDHAFGTVIVLGIGGIYTELLKKTLSIIHPTSFEQFSNIIANNQVLTQYFGGFRNMPRVNIKELWQTTLEVGYLIDTYREITAIDINPLFATAEGLVAADARIILR